MEPIKVELDAFILRKISEAKRVLAEAHAERVGTEAFYAKHKQFNALAVDLAIELIYSPEVSKC